MSLLGTDDNLEAHLRCLASVKFRMRTGDTVAAAQMLALHAPGSATDVAPSWLVADVTLHSKTEHQRSERLAAAANKTPSASPKGQSKEEGRWPRSRW